MELARRHYKERNKLTRFFARTCIGIAPLEWSVLTVGKGAVKFGGQKIALTACSLLFNLRYLQGMCRELGGRAALWQAIQGKEGQGETVH